LIAADINLRLQSEEIGNVLANEARNYYGTAGTGLPSASVALVMFGVSPIGEPSEGRSALFGAEPDLSEVGVGAGISCMLTRLDGVCGGTSGTAGLGAGGTGRFSPEVSPL